MILHLFYLLTISRGTILSINAKFVLRSHDLLRHQNIQDLTNGVAVSDVNMDGRLDWIVGSFSGSNLILIFDNQSQILQNIASSGSPFEAVMDPGGQTIGVATCDIDGDGREEIYFMNANSDLHKQMTYSDRLFKWVGNRYVDLMSDPINIDVKMASYVGQSIACVDRKGQGKYSFIVVTCSNDGLNKVLLIEMDESHPANNVSLGSIVLRNAAEEAGLNIAVNGRGIVVGPILGTDGRSDIFINCEKNEIYNENGGNKLFMNIGNGKFKDVGSHLGVGDPDQKGRGVAITDINGDGLIDIVYGNWLGPHRLFIQNRSNYSGNVKFIDMAPGEMQQRSAIKTVTIADFDNDGNQEIFFSNVIHNGSQPNKLFTIKYDFYRSYRQYEFKIIQEDVGDASEPSAYSTGSGVTDIDNDGMIDILITHGVSSRQSLTIYADSSSRTSFKRPLNGSKVNRAYIHGSDYVKPVESSSVPNNRSNNGRRGNRESNYKWREVTADTKYAKPVERLNMNNGNNYQSADSRSRLVDSRFQFANSRSRLVDSRSQSADSRSRLADSRSRLADSRSRLADSRSHLANSRSRSADTRPIRKNYYWIRVLPKTRFGAPARGSKVTLILTGGHMMVQITGGGSGFPGSIEPVAHFGLGNSTDILFLEVQWPDGRIYQKNMGIEDLNKVHEFFWKDTYKARSIYRDNKIDKHLIRTAGGSRCIHTEGGLIVMLIILCICIVINFRIIS